MNSSPEVWGSLSVSTPATSRFRLGSASTRGLGPLRSRFRRNAAGPVNRCQQDGPFASRDATTCGVGPSRADGLLLHRANRNDGQGRGSGADLGGSSHRRSGVQRCFRVGVRRTGHHGQRRLRSIAGRRCWVWRAVPVARKSLAVTYRFGALTLGALALSTLPEPSSFHGNRLCAPAAGQPVSLNQRRRIGYRRGPPVAPPGGRRRQQPGSRTLRARVVGGWSPPGCPHLGQHARRSGIARVAIAGDPGANESNLSGWCRRTAGRTNPSPGSGRSDPGPAGNT